ncbi:MAG TPA: VWA domain-containing protein, partial [Vicinamibacteria bacterium]|nr:VWA domain-containing protein [Vicinamibacteria bacterium]
EEGRPQQISHVALHHAAAYARPAAGAPRAVAGARVPVEVAPRLFVLAVDELHLLPQNVQRAREALKRFVARVPEGDRVAIFTSTGVGAVLQSFTDDREVLREAVGRVAPRAHAPEGLHDIPRLGIYQASLIDRLDRKARDAAISEVLRDDPGLLPQMAAAIVDSKARVLMADARRTAKAALDTLRTHMLLLRQVPGRKVVVFVSDGFYLDSDGSADLREVSGLAAYAGAAFYSLDMRGLESKLTSGDVTEGGRVLGFDTERYRRQEFEQMRQGLNALARDTGGLPLFNQADPAAALDRALEDSAVWYRIAYSPSDPPRPGVFRKVEVRVNRPGVHVRTFKGYLPGLNVKAAPALDRLQQALLSLAPVNEIAPELALGWLDTSEGPSAVVATRLDPGAWAGAARGQRSVPVKLRGLILDAANQPVARFDDEREVRLDSARPEPALTFATQTVLKPGKHQVRVAVQAGERMGTAFGSIDIPDSSVATLAVSDVFVSH